MSYGHIMYSQVCADTDKIYCNYHLQTKFAKVMFLQVSVCPHWGGACMVLCRGVCMVYLGGHAWFYLGEGHAWFYLGGHAWFYSGACVVLFRGMCGFILGACVVLFGGACMVLFGGHVWFYSRGMRGFSWGCMVFQFFQIQ